MRLHGKFVSLEYKIVIAEETTNETSCYLVRTALQNPGTLFYCPEDDVRVLTKPIHKTKFAKH